MKKKADFAFACTPYLGEDHYKDNDNYRGWEKYPHLIKFLRNEQRYDVPQLTLNAP